MSSEVVLHGTLKPDGTLELDQKPNLAPGPVLVRIQPSAPVGAARRGLADVIHDIRAGQQARGFQGRTGAEIQAEETARQVEDDEYEQRMQTLWSQTRNGARPPNP